MFESSAFNRYYCNKWQWQKWMCCDCVTKLKTQRVGPTHWYDELAESINLNRSDFLANQIRCGLLSWSSYLDCCLRWPVAYVGMFRSSPRMKKADRIRLGKNSVGIDLRKILFANKNDVFHGSNFLTFNVDKLVLFLKALCSSLWIIKKKKTYILWRVFIFLHYEQHDIMSHIKTKPRAGRADYFAKNLEGGRSISTFRIIPRNKLQTYKNFVPALIYELFFFISQPTNCSDVWLYLYNVYWTRLALKRSWRATMRLLPVRWGIRQWNTIIPVSLLFEND